MPYEQNKNCIKINLCMTVFLHEFNYYARTNDNILIKMLFFNNLKIYISVIFLLILFKNFSLKIWFV